MPNVACLERISLWLLQNKQNSLVAWPRTYRIPISPNKPFKNLGTQRTGNALSPRALFPSTRQTDQKTIGPFAPTRAPQTKAQQLPRSVEGNHLRSRNLKRCVGISNPFSLCSCSVTRSSYNMFSFDSSPCGCRSEQTSLNGGSKRDPILNRQFLQQNLSDPKERGNISPCNRLESPQHVCGELPFSNGKYLLSQDSFKKRRLYDMYRLKGCIPLCSRTQILTKVPLFPMEKQNICLSRSAVWAKYSSQSVYKTNKTHSCFPTEERYSNNRLPRRFSNSRLLHSRVNSKHPANTHPSTAAGFHHKLGEVYPGAHPVLNFSGPFHRLTGNVTQPPRGKDSEYTEQMSTPSPKLNSCSSRGSKSDRDIGGRSPCHLASPPPLQIPTNTAHKVPADISRQLRDTHVFEQQCSSRTTVVAPECCNRKRQCDQSSSHRPIHNIRRLQNRLGCVVRELNRKRPLVASGSQTTHKRPRIESGLSCRQSLPQGQGEHCGMSPHGQHYCYCPREQQRGNTFPTTCQLNSETVAVVSSEINPDHCSTLTRQAQQHSRQRIQGVLRLQRVANRPTTNPTLHNRVQCRPFCLSLNSHSSNICQLETRPRGILHGCNDTELGHSERLRLSTIQSDSTSSEKSLAGQSGSGLDSSSLAGTTLVASSPEPSNQETSHDPELQILVEGPCIPPQNPSNVSQAPSGRLSYIREQHQTEGFSEDITEILLSATRTSTHKTYQSAWGQWNSWCAKRKVNPVSATLNDVLLFLTDRFKCGAAYRSVNVVRSAISSCHPKIDGYPVGQHPLVVQLLKGMQNMRPPQPRYTHTWDVQLVTKYLDSLGKTKLLPLKLISIKLAILFALSCPERASSLARLDLRYCRVAPEGVSFTLTLPRKRGSTDQLPQAFFASFPHNKRLCPVDTLRVYLKATRNLRPVFPSSKPDPLFVSYVKPHNPITTPTLSRWLRTAIKNAGIDTELFKAHSVRGASTTAAANSNVPLDEVMKMADWSRVSTFQKFYYKPVFKASYGHSVLK